PALAALAGRHPGLAWSEREMRDRFGIELHGHPDPRPLLSPPAPDGDKPGMPRVEGDGIAVFPLGPVRGGIAESARFRRAAAGERVIHVAPQLFFKHRGVERRAEGLAPAQAVALAERLCGSCAVANAVGLAQALERLSGVEPPRRADWLRTALLEMERLASHL